MGPNLAEFAKNYSSRVKKFAAKKSNPTAMVQTVNNMASMATAISYAVLMVANLISNKKSLATISYSVAAVVGAINAVTTFKNGSK